MSLPQSAAQGSARASLPTLGRYEILCEIASGGMAKVYLGRVRGAGAFERLVAVKRCHPHLRKQKNYATMFLDEARLAARIHHPNVVSTVDVQDADDLYMVMEYVEGDRLEALADAAANAGTHIPLKVLLRITLDVLAGLDAAHELVDETGRKLNVVHRDVSPQNILVGVDGTTRITDFGIAKDTKRNARATGGAPRGKLPYMSPEQVNSEPLTRASDLFSLGVVLWECLTNQRLFDGDVEAVVMLKIASGKYPLPSQIRPDVPPAIDRIVMRALGRTPSDRYRSAAEFADAIEQSGLEVGNNRAVAACVSQMLARTIARRREMLNRLRTPGEEVDLDELESTIATPMPKGAARALATIAPRRDDDEDDTTEDGNRRPEDTEEEDDRTVKTGPNFLAEIHSLVMPTPTAPSGTAPPRASPARSTNAPPVAYATSMPSAVTVGLPSVRPSLVADTARPVARTAPDAQRAANDANRVARALYAVSALLVLLAVVLVSAALHNRVANASHQPAETQPHVATSPLVPPPAVPGAGVAPPRVDPPLATPQPPASAPPPSGATISPPSRAAGSTRVQTRPRPAPHGARGGRRDPEHFQPHGL